MHLHLTETLDRPTEGRKVLCDMRFPCQPWNPDVFEWMAFRSMFGTQAVNFTGWEQAVDFHAEVLAKPFEKGQGPAYAGFTGPSRLKHEVQTLTSFTVDVDEGNGVHQALFRLRDDLLAQDISYLLQYRTSSIGQQKAHLIIPFCKGYDVVDPNDLATGRLTFLNRLAEHYGFSPDRSVCQVNGVVFAYASRKGEPKPNQDANIGANALDFHALHQPMTTSRVPRRLKSEEEAAREFDALRKALTHDGLLGPWSEAKQAWEITCPHLHGAEGRNKTLLYPSGHVSCMAGKCAFRSITWFISALSPEAQAIALEGGSARLRDALSRAVTEKVSLEQAERALIEALGDVSPVDRNATVIRITPGAGKTRAIAKHLNRYSAPAEDGFGRTAVLATPTNALLREVEERIEIPHKRRVGVLAVLNDDGTPACRKHTVAKALQTAGGDVHRLLCGHCEWKETCPARRGATIGDGSLVLTNHALMPSVAKDLHEHGRHPMIVWDESPQMVRVATLPKEDLDWVSGLFREEAEDRGGAGESVLNRIVAVQAFTPKYRAAIRPMLEILKRISEGSSTRVDLGEVSDSWARTPYNAHLVHRALAVSHLEETKPKYPGSTWDDVVSSFREAKRINVLQMGFDEMPRASQEKILRVERILTALDVLAGPGAKVVSGPVGLLMGCLTENGVLWRDHGGVVLDATANVSELRALRPDLRVVTLAVEDGGSVERTATYSGSLSRTALGLSATAFSSAVQRARARVRTFGKGTGAEPKTVCFTYRSQVEYGKRLWPEADWHHFGDTRGYDHWFQDGYGAYVSVGDPVANLTSLAVAWMVVRAVDDVEESPEWWGYVAASAESELAQAHGRARDPQRTKAETGSVLHLHYGRHIPSGWDLTNAQVDLALT